MGRRPLERTCCSCLTKGLHFNKLSKKDQNVTLLIKLKSCIKDVEWMASYHICIECTSVLNICYEFLETCLNSDYIRKVEQDGVKRDENKFKEETLTENQFEIHQESKQDNYVTKGEIKDEMRDDDVNVKDDDLIVKDDDVSEEVCSNTGDNDDVNDPSYSGGSDQENDTYRSDHVDVKCNLQKQKKRKIVRKYQEKKESPRKKRKKLNFECEKCQTNFSASTKLVVHCTEEHGMDLKDVKPFVCDRCPQRFSTSSNLWQHIKYHDGIKSNMCSYCGKGFITKTDLLNHEKKHLNMREYECEACGKSFNTHKDIRSHRLIVHTDSSKWKYACEICNKPFPIKSNYDSHMRRHTGDKKFACHLCEKKFTTKCDLQRHYRSHSHVREHQCPHCEKEYKDERVLKVHMAKIHGIGLGKVKIPVRERKYACHFCPKAYYAKNKLTRHIYTHSGEKPFNCPICEKKFNDKSYVKQHLRNTHNVEHQDTLENELKFSYMNFSAPEVGLV